MHEHDVCLDELATSLSIVVCVLLRPEGALVSGLLILIELVVERRIPRFTLTCVAAAFVLSLPYVGFKLYYYGSILPNPFYAKTGLHADVFVSGLEYAGRFFAHYGFFGVGFLGSALLWSRLARSGRTVLLYAAAYTVYIIIVGGDVLKVHRFFLPLFGPAAILVALVAQHVTSRMRVRTQSLIITAVGVCLLSLTYFLPRGFVEQYNYLERSFVIKMRTMATNITASDSSIFSVALPTIGVFGFELMGHRIIDLVGLTDSTIARHSEEPIPGMETTWKEQKHNSAYVLSQEPDYIQFSTGIKPSAPAERALVLYPQFQQSYRSIGWYFSIDPNRQGVIHSVFKKVRPLIGELKPTYPVDFVENYKLGLDAAVAGDFATAVQFYGRALKASPKPYYVNLLANRAYCHMMLQQHDKAQALLEYILSTDSLVYEAHQYQYFYSNMAGDSASAAYHLSWLEKLVPWYVPRIKMLAARQTQSSQRPRR
ncbi:MAG: tetratricopeptide repeat protein [Candidatus Zixiibacteriota bacterium]